ncbi:ABC transporter ATP-binding protein [Amphibiibacter pelophylacis]|uniref:ABC transporter ATP-binding protein n=1 Tax=Amphibiibacter pelophylacis TaxID=1799477 RepID=A0ACC6P5H6_9BURK
MSASAVKAAAAASDIDLSVRSVSRHYGSFHAVDQLSFDVVRGQFFSILGPSGCGKTTLLRMIAGFVQPDAGDIVIAGRSMQGVAPNRRPVNMVFQHLALFPMMSVGDNVAYGLAQRGLSRRERQAKAAAMLERVGLPGTADKRIDQMSGGQKQRVAIARALVLEPTLLLLDEPLGALDLKLREHMKLELKQIQADFGTTFVYITHDQSEALVMSDQVAVMNHGRFEQVGTPRQLYREPASAFVAGFVGHSNRASGRIVRSSASDELQLDGGPTIPLNSVSAHSTPAGAAQVFVRPEQISLAAQSADLPDGLPRWPVTVQSLLFDGASSMLMVRFEGGLAWQVTLAQHSLDRDWSVGAPAWLALDPAQMQVFAA